MAKQITNLSSDGMVFGQTVSDKIGFFGATAVVKYATTLSAGQMSSSAATITTVQAIITALAAYGMYTIGG